MLVLTRPHYLAGSQCGYCHGEKNTIGPDGRKRRHITVGMQVEQMTCSHYDLLINLGFRRSGTFVYKGDMLRGCCRMYTLRTNTGLFRPKKEHRQVVNRFKRAIGAEGPAKSFSLAQLSDAEKKSTRFRTRFEPSRFSHEKFTLYKKYQTRVHNDDPDDVTETSFVRFLCDTPFSDDEVYGTPEEWDRLNRLEGARVGPAHECYYLDNELIAVSVMDMLPSGLSSIYFIWDPDYAHLSLGTLLGLRELLLCQKLGLAYYYLGYYIDDCVKMRYKAKFGGEVLDVCSETYVPLEKALPHMRNDRFFAMDTGGRERSMSFAKPRAFCGEVAPNTFYDSVSEQMAGAIPRIFPGAAPYEQALAMAKEMVFTFVDGHVGEVTRGRLMQLSPARRRHAVDAVRLIGPMAAILIFID